MSTISLRDLNEVFVATYDARAKWRNLMLALGLDYPTIESIASKWRDNPDDCYREGLCEWLKSRERSWEDVVKALSTNTVGHSDLARKIESDYGFLQVPFPITNPLPQPAVQPVLNTPSSHNVIAREGHYMPPVITDPYFPQLIPAQFYPQAMPLSTRAGPEQVQSNQFVDHCATTNVIAEQKFQDDDLELAGHRPGQFKWLEPFQKSEEISDANLDFPLQELRPPLTLTWRKGKSMPIEMRNTTNIVIGDIVYVGGGVSSNGQHHTVLKLDLKQNVWSGLPEYHTTCYAMTSLNNKLILVGGYHERCKISKEPILMSFFENDKWVPILRTRVLRHGASTAVSYKQHIIVIGGYDTKCTCISSVMVFHIESRNWYIGNRLPNARAEMKAALIGSTLYLMGGVKASGWTKTVYTVDLDKLIEKATSDTPCQSTPSPWQSIQDTPLYCSAPLSIGGSLFAVGGHDSGPSSSIHLYVPDTQDWIKVGDLPTARRDCACSLLSNGEVIVTGGYKHDCFMDNVDFLSIASADH